MFEIYFFKKKKIQLEGERKRVHCSSSEPSEQLTRAVYNSPSRDPVSAPVHPGTASSTRSFSLILQLPSTVLGADHLLKHVRKTFENK